MEWLLWSVRGVLLLPWQENVLVLLSMQGNYFLLSPRHKR